MIPHPSLAYRRPPATPYERAIVTRYRVACMVEEWERQKSYRAWTTFTFPPWAAYVAQMGFVR